MEKVNQKFINNNPEDITLKELVLKIKSWWKFLLSKWIVISIAVVIGGAVGLIYAVKKKTVYTAELTFTLEDDKSSGGMSGALGLASQFGFNVGATGGSAFSGDNISQLMKSRSMVEKALLSSISIKGKNLTLVEYYINFNDLRNNWKGNLSLLNTHFLANSDRSKFTLTQDSILGVFHENITTNNIMVNKLDKGVSIITLRVVSTNELFSKYFTDILAKVVSDFYVQTKTAKESQNVAILQRQTDSVKRELNAALSGVASSADINPNPNPSLQILRVPSQRRQVDVQANQAMLTQLVTNLEVSKLSLRKETPLIEVIDKPILPLKKEKLGKFKGVVVGGFLAIFLTILLLSISMLFKRIMSDV